MGPRKRFRQGKAAAPSNPTPAPTPLQPSQATTTSQVSSLSAASEPSTQTTTPSMARRVSDKVVPPLQLEPSSTSAGSSNIHGQDSKAVQKTTSWYGSLSRKSTASLSIQRETIKGSPLKAGSTPDFHRYDLKRTGDTASLSGASQASVNASSMPPSSGAEAPAANALGTNSNDLQAENSEIAENTRKSLDGHATQGIDRTSGTEAEAPTSDASAVEDSPQQQVASSGWLGGWFARAPLPASTTKDDANQPTMPAQPEVAKPTEASQPSQEDIVPTTTTVKTNTAISNDQTTPTTTTIQPTSSWLGYLWSSKAAPEGEKAEPSKTTETVEILAPAPEALPKNDEPSNNLEHASKPTAGSTWAFWSRETPKTPGVQEQPPETGELAVVGDRSERHPKRANSTDMKEDIQPPKEEPLKAQTDKSKSNKDKLSKRFSRARPQGTDLDSIPSRPVTPQPDTTQSKPESPSKSKSKAPAATPKPAPPNLLLPSFKDTYRMKESPSILKQITTFLMRTQQKPPNHVFLTEETPKIRKAIAIGVHGLFPASFLRPMIGQPTGTSIKFANHCAESIRRWADAHGCGDCEIEKVALEGEGKIDFRVTNLWSLLQNWLDHIKEADLVMIACHSQGVPVSMMLLEKLIDCGAIGHAKVGVCAMAGVNLGPFAEYKSSMGILMGSAAELWEFANSESEVSKKYESALKKALQYGVRVSYVGSIDDQLVPMESAIFSPVNHPYVYRAVFVDGRIHASDFITHLVGFACKLRNLGISDHGLIRELSMSLAGSLYGGEGHSRLYDDVQVYDLAISHTLETTDVGTIPCEIARYEGLTQPNPFVLPWIMRGLLEEDFVKTELSTETDQLLQRFDDWKPTTKPLQNVKYRLEAVRSRL